MKDSMPRSEQTRSVPKAAPAPKRFAYEIDFRTSMIRRRMLEALDLAP